MTEDPKPRRRRRRSRRRAKKGAADGNATPLSPTGDASFSDSDGASAMGGDVTIWYGDDAPTTTGDGAPPARKRRRGASRRRRRSTKKADASAQTQASEASAPPADGEGGHEAEHRVRSHRRGRARKRPRSTDRGPRRDRGEGQWWARQWSHSLDGIRVGRRVGHGRAYARQGRVLELAFEKGSATALVQGSRDAPYLIRMQLAMIPTADWRRILRALGEDPDLGSGLMRGKLPRGVEEVCSALGLSLFPGRPGDLKAACSCPDQANPCKHIAAVFYALGEEIARDPFQLLHLRGLERGELVEALARSPAARAPLVAPPSAEALARSHRRRPPALATAEAAPGAAEDVVDDTAPRADDAAVATPATRARAKARAGAKPGARAGAKAGKRAPATRADTARPARVPPTPRNDPLPVEPQDFWAGPADEPGQDRAAEARIPDVAGALASRLGGYPLGGIGSNLVMDQIYREASLAGLAIFLGHGDHHPQDAE